MQIALRAARSLAKQVLDFALPPRCPGCAAVTLEEHRFCLNCWQALHFIADPCCRRCGLPFDFNSGEDAECGGCLANPPPYDRLRAAVAYGDIARKVVLKLKYSGRPAAAETIAHFMQRLIADRDNEAMLVPVPLHRWRIWKRGYNQSALIASALSRRTGHRAELDVLRRVKSTPALRGLTRRERALAVSGAFGLSARGLEAVRGRTIILVDDVYTSGATVNACTKALKRSGATKVEIICWARVLRQGDD